MALLATGRRADRELQDRHHGALGHRLRRACRSAFRGLVWCRVSGFGADGPLGALPGYDAAVQAMTGIMSVNGEADGGPLRVGLPVVDMVTGLNATIGVLLALQERAKSGRTVSSIEAALYDSGLSLLHPHAANWFVDGQMPKRTGNAHPNIYPYDALRTGTRSDLPGSGQ